STSPMRQELENWDCAFNADSRAAVIFEEWWRSIVTLTWDEFFRLKSGAEIPGDLILLKMIAKDPTNDLFDLESTEKIETADDIINLALEQVEKTVDEKITWGEVNSAKLIHLSNIDQLGRLNLLQGGHPRALNAFTQDSGPSLRMIVDMSDRPKGYGIYAGGQTGNPASLDYQEFVQDWIDGKYYQLDFYQNQKEAKPNYKWILK
ncbi:MAG: penicillin acylase family protein, partial [Crocinitomicaceae bacterium]